MSFFWTGVRSVGITSTVIDVGRVLVLVLAPAPAPALALALPLLIPLHPTVTNLLSCDPCSILLLLVMCFVLLYVVGVIDGLKHPWCFFFFFFFCGILSYP